ncbi:GlxA family transcriptional regulator [Labrenzia sp. VG12]|uniref:GlxA family transcriptional regulator n=1 Tax=Labrenzia sp. VG12 TaxID=2021862 RepID=UPI000B8C4D45|nr:helix-turn-helix domain-containing protein [Labrenzia sp. VG12]ASP33829.1 AraC family transcriptional regulator [Labrenzia sp. VG12]
MQVSEKSSASRKICVFLFDKFSVYCLANAVEPFRAANTIARRQLYVWEHVSLDGGTVTSSSGLPVDTRSWAEAMPTGDFLFVMPSYDYTQYAGARMQRVLRAARGRFTTLVGMDTGAWLMASAGLLDGRQATIHWDELSLFAETFPEVDVVEDRVVAGRDTCTCGGASTTFELTLELIKQQHGALFALEVSANFMHGDAFERQDPRLRLTADSLVRSAAALMRRTLETPLTIAELAARLNIDQRSLEDHFRQEVGMTPLGVYKAIRLREARRLVELTRLSIAEISERCGYRNSSAMTRAYRLEFGQPPRAHRH